MKINGLEITGNSVSVINGIVLVDGVQFGDKLPEPVRIEVEGDLVSLITGAPVTVRGSIRGDVKVDGPLTIRGSVEGNVEADGPVTCGDIGGNLYADGPIMCSNYRR